MTALARRWQPALQALFFCFGSALFVHWVLSFGTRELASALLSLSAKAWAGLLALYACSFACDTRAWQLVFRSSLASRARFSALYLIRMAGEALNAVTPVVDIGGEPLKFHLCVRGLGLPRRDALVSIIITRTTLLVGTVLFILAAATAAVTTLPFPAPAKVQIFLTAWGVSLAAFGIYWIQKRGVFDHLNRGLAAFYARHPDRIGLAVSYHLLGWCFACAETYWMARCLGVPITAFEAFTIEGLLQLIRMACFFIPMNLGAQEGGFILLLPLLGYDPGAALGVALLKRARQVVWMSAGYALWAYSGVSVRHKYIKLK